MTAPAPRHLVSVDQIGDMLRARISDLVERVWQLPGRRDGHDWVCLSPLRADRTAGSFRICLDGPLKGMVKDFASNETWSPLSFSAALMFRGDLGQALRWARAWLGVDALDPAAIEQVRPVVEASVNAGPDADAEKNRGTAYRRWLEARENVIDTPVDTYLRGRGIDLRALPYPVRSLRYHPHLHNAETDRPWPAMVAGVVGVNGKFLACHRTYLEVRADGRVTKAPLECPKKVMGSFRGGAIRLWRGTRTDPKTGEVKQARPLSEAPIGTWVDVTEGIEDGLSVALAEPEVRVLVGISVANIGALALPETVAGVALWAQNDPPASPAAAALEKSIDRLRQGGRTVRVIRPPPEIKDVNEWLTRLHQERVREAQNA